LINVAENADQWTIAALAQAIKNDPVNPRLRLELGGVFYSLGQYDQAIRFYQQAAELKPDWGNAFYNLSAAHKQKKEMVQAYDYLRQVIALVEPNTADYTKAQSELAELSNLLKVKETDKPEVVPATGDLTYPTPAPSRTPKTNYH
jgi:tetratricopeptide (TPR) repeat protein